MPCEGDGEADRGRVERKEEMEQRVEATISISATS